MSWWRTYKYAIIVPVILILVLLILLLFAPGAGDEDPFVYQFH